MFKNLLPSNLNVFATTASNATTSSFACYFDESLLNNRKFMENVVEQVITTVTAGDDSLTNLVFTDNVELTKFDCYYAAVDLFHERCFNLGKNDYALRMLNPF